MEELVNLFVNNGTAIAVIIYFMWRDAKFMSKLESSLSALILLIGEMKEERTDRND